MEAEMKQIKTIHVPNIGCDGCVRTIQNEVGSIPGVTKVVADLDTKTVVIEWTEPADWEQINDRLVEIDYAPEMA
jgi:copper chaperone CopZ